MANIQFIDNNGVISVFVDGILLDSDTGIQLYKSRIIKQKQLENKSNKLTNVLNYTNFDNNILKVKINYE